MEQPRHLGSDRLHLGELSGRGEQRQPAVVRDRVALDRGLAESALELEQGVAPGEPRLGLQLLNRHPFDIPELGEERPLASVRTARSSQGRAQVTGAVRDSSDQLELLEGEVVEPIEEDGREPQDSGRARRAAVVAAASEWSSWRPRASRVST